MSLDRTQFSTMLLEDRNDPSDSLADDFEEYKVPQSYASSSFLPNLAMPLLSSGEDESDVVIEVGQLARLRDDFVNQAIQMFTAKQEAIENEIQLHLRSFRRERVGVELIFFTLILIVGGSLFHFITSYLKFSSALKNYDETPLNNSPEDSCGTHFPYKSSFLEGCWTTEGYLKDATKGQNPECYDGINAICSGPGMWHGYFAIIIGFGMLTPTILCSFSRVFAYNLGRITAEKVRRTYFPNAQRIQEIINFLSHLNRDEKAILNRTEETKRLTDNPLTDQYLSNLIMLYRRIIEEGLKYQSRLSFMLGSLACNNKAPLNLLFNKLNGEPKLAKNIFEMIDLDEDSEQARPARQAFVRSTYRGLFYKLNQDAAKDNKQYDKEAIISKIYAYANIGPTRL